MRKTRRNNKQRGGFFGIGETTTNTYSSQPSGLDNVMSSIKSGFDSASQSVSNAYNSVTNSQPTYTSTYEDPNETTQNTTWISNIGIYDEHKNLIAIATLANPVKKTENRDFTFKLKLDM